VNRAGFVWKQVKARPLRSSLTVAAFALSVGLLGFLLVLNDALQKDWSLYQAQRVIVTAKSSLFERLPIAYLNRIEGTPGVKRVAAFDFVMGFWKDSRAENQVPLSAASVDDLLDVYREADVPLEQVAAWKADPTGCIVGPVLMEKFGWKVGERLVLKAPVNGGVLETTIRGVLRYKLDNGVYVHRKYFEGMTGEQGKAAMFWILAATKDDVQKVTDLLEKKFENAPYPVTVMTEKQWQLMFMQMLGNVKALIGSVGLATAFALLLITGNTLAMSARERRGESGVLRVLGFGRHEVAGLLLAEAVFYGVAGAVAGTGLIYAFGYFVGMALDKTQLAGIGGLLVPDPASILVAVVASGVLAVLAGIVPAVGLSRTSIAALIREPR
jgi:putative ABC transport system permease protein